MKLFFFLLILTFSLMPSAYAVDNINIRDTTNVTIG